MMTFKKYLAYLLATMMMASALVACGNGKNSISSDTNLEEDDFVYDDTPIKKEVAIPNETSTEAIDMNSITSETIVSVEDTEMETAFQTEDKIDYEDDTIENTEYNVPVSEDYDFDADTNGEIVEDNSIDETADSPPTEEATSTFIEEESVDFVIE